MRTKRFVTYTVVAVVVAVGAYAVYKLLSRDEEAPIIVRNGSMDFLAGDDPSKNHHWKWNRPGGNGVFLHEPTYPHSRVQNEDLRVHVMGTPTGGCTTDTAGPTVKVTFGDNFSVTLSRFQLGSSGQFRTRIEGSSADLSEVIDATRPTLRHRSSDANHYITSVTVGTSAPCTFSAASALTRICISPDDPTQACQE